MKLSNKAISTILFILSIGSFVVAGILNFVNKGNTVGYIFLCFGAAFLCFGSVWLNKNTKENEESEENNKK